MLDDFSTGRPANLAVHRAAAKVEIVAETSATRRPAPRPWRDVESVYHQAALRSVPRSIAEPLAPTRSTSTARQRAEAARTPASGGSSSPRRRRPTATARAPKSEDEAPAPMSPYAVVQSWPASTTPGVRPLYGVDTVVLRYFNVFGPRQDPTARYAAAIPRFMWGAPEANRRRLRRRRPVARLHLHRQRRAGQPVGRRRPGPAKRSTSAAAERVSLLDIISRLEAHPRARSSKRRPYAHARR